MGFTIRPCTIRHNIYFPKYTKSMISPKMYHNLVVLIILGISIEIQCQRHIIGSRLLNFDNDMRFVSPIERQARNSKDIEFEKPSTTAKPNIRTVKDSTFDSSSAFNSNAVDNAIDDFEECVPLDKCESLDWLVQNIDTVPNLSPSQITDTIKDRICGFYGRMPKVLCPFDDNNELDGTEDYAEEYTDDDDNNDDIKGTTSVPSNVDETGDALSFEPIKNGGFTFGESVEPSKNETRSENCRSLGCRAIFNDIGTPARQRCRGSLLIHHSANNAAPLSDFKQLRLRGKNFRQMRKLRRRNIVQMQTHGNCCWTLYSKPKFRGAEEKFYNGYNIVPKVHPKSIKASHCN